MTLDKSISEEIKTLMEEIRKQNRYVLEKCLYELLAACHISKEISSTLDLENCLKILVNRIADLMSVEIVSLMLLDQDKGELLIKLAKGLDDEIIREARPRVGENIAGWIAKSGEPLLIKDITKDSRFFKRDGKYYTNSLLSVPLKVQNKVIGVINVNNKASKDIFKPDDLDILKTIADMASVAIENARLYEETKSLDKLKTDFITNVSHELRTPLAAIKETIGIILAELTGSINKEQRHFLELTKQNIDRLKRLIDQLLDLTKLESKKAGMKRCPFNIAGLMDTAVTSLKPLAESSKNSISSSLPSRKIVIWGDQDKLNQVMINLIDNAIKYNKPGGNVEVSLKDTDKTVTISVSDTGIGIPAKELGRIFDRFYRIEKTDKAKGMGLGLAIVKEIVEMHGGTIYAESEVGRGSRFTLTLPKDLRSK